MELLSLTVCLLLALLTIISFVSIAKNRDRGLPPGPRPLPIIGNLLNLNSKVHLSFQLAELAKRYGPLMTLHLGRVPTVVVSSSVMAREALQKNDSAFSDRFVLDAFRGLNHHLEGLVWLPPTLKWRNLRKICNTHVFSTTSLEASQSLREKKIEELMSHVRKSSESGVALNIGQAAFNITLNVLSSTFFSVDLADYESQLASDFKLAVRGIMDEAGKPNLGDFFPLIRKLDLQGIKRRGAVCFGHMSRVFSTIIHQRLQGASSSSSSTSSDVLDKLLGGSNNQEKAHPDINHSNIIHLLADLFGAGTDTTSSTLEWAMAELLHHPEIMRKAQAEVRQIVGQGKSVQESDIAQLPYLQAVVKETLRLYPPAPIPVPRKAISDVKLLEFTVPKNTQLLVNVWAIARDPDVWENPNSFQLERFLGSEIDVKGRHFDLLPFGAGRRICLGMPLAIRILQLTLASLIHGFDWKLEPGISPQDMDMETSLGLTLERAHRLHAVPVAV